jgi:hypothetical protein
MCTVFSHSPSVDAFSENVRHVANTHLKTICIVCNNFLFVFFLAIFKCCFPCLFKEKEVKDVPFQVSVAMIYMFLRTLCLCVRVQMWNDLTDHCMVVMSWFIQSGDMIFLAYWLCRMITTNKPFCAWYTQFTLLVWGRCIIEYKIEVTIEAVQTAWLQNST